VQPYFNCVSFALGVTISTASTVAVLSFWKPGALKLERWLISTGKGCGEIHCPMCGQSVSGVTGSSSTSLGHQE
jgi:hypothetical protein